MLQLAGHEAFQESAMKALILESNRMTSKLISEEMSGVAFSRSWILSHSAAICTQLLPFAVMAPSTLMHRLVSDAVHHPGVCVKPW